MAISRRYLSSVITARTAPEARISVCTRPRGLKRISPNLNHYVVSFVLLIAAVIVAFAFKPSLATG
jgi:hypothetical protein